MLLERNQVIELLRCPKYQAPLALNGNNLISQTNEPLHTSTYEFVDQYPVVIDFEQSILNKKDTESATSVINRPSYAGLSGMIKRILLPRSKATKDNVELLFTELLKKDGKPRVLMVGGGTPGQSMEQFYEDPRIELVSFDIYASDSVQFVADAHNHSGGYLLLHYVLQHLRCNCKRRAS